MCCPLAAGAPARCKLEAMSDLDASLVYVAGAVAGSNAEPRSGAGANLAYFA